jgi:hypothetical protein
MRRITVQVDLCACLPRYLTCDIMPSPGKELLHFPSASFYEIFALGLHELLLQVGSTLVPKVSRQENFLFLTISCARN